jgi:hypothetical protein
MLIKFVVVDDSTYVSFNVSVMFTALDRTQRVLLFLFYPAWGEGFSTIILILALFCDSRRPLLDVERVT